MAGPEKLDLSGATWSGPATQEERGKEANIRQSQTSTARGEADLPYIAPTAKEQLDRIILQNQQLQRDLEKAKKGEPLAGDDKTRLITDVDAYDKLMRAIQKFDPDYAGTVLDFPGEIENVIQKRISSDFGTPGQADFWSAMKFLDMLTRNKYFGASLTGSEKQSYAETTISPGVTPETALANLKRRAETVRTGIQRNVRSLMEGGYRPAQINAQLGQYLPELNPRWLPASSERVLADYASSEDYDPSVYQKMLLEFGDANGVRLEPAAAEASANAVAEMRAKGQTSFGGDAVYRGLEQPEEERDETGAGAGPTGGDGGDGDDGLGWGETLGSAIVNLPRSTAEELGGIFEAFLSPVQTAKSIGSLGGALLSKMGVADFDESSADALGQYYANKYGSIEGFKKELANNPASILADVATVLTAGAGTVTKLGLPAKIAKLGPRAKVAQQWAGAVARNVDPITAMTNVVTKAVPAAVKATTKGAGTLTSGALGLTTGAGGDAISEAAKVGFERSTAGTSTAAADAFLSAMRNPNASADELVKLARDAVGNLRQQASQRYLDKMAQFGRNPAPLDISRVRQRITDIKPASYDTWKDSEGPRPSEHRAWETMNQFVDEYAYKATQNPTLLEPLALDQFKQDLYDVGSKVGGAYDRDAARIAGTAYSAVKDELVNFDPIYADAMKGYEDAATQAQQLESTFSLAAGRGKKPNIESAGRKLSQALRNNVNTNFGTRRAQVDELAALDKTGKLLPMLAGQALNTFEPRGLGRLTSGAAATSGIAGIGLNMIPMSMDVPGYLSGANLATLPLMSPRAVGEAAYYGGRGVGAVNRAISPVTSRLGTSVNTLADLQKKYRDPLVYTAFGAQNIGAMEAEPVVVDEDEEFFILSDGAKIRKSAEQATELSERYGEPAPAEPARAEPAVAPVEPAPINLKEEGEFDPVTRTYLLPDGTRVDEANNIVEMARGGSVQQLRKGGRPKKQTSWYDDLTMAVSRRSNALVAAAADLADKYGITPAQSAAWVAKQMGHSPQEVAAIRRNLGGVGNFRNVVNAGAASNEQRFRQQGGRGSRAPDMVTPPVRMADIAYRAGDIPRAVVSETPRALEAAGNYVRNTTPRQAMQDARRAGGMMVDMVKEDPYGFAFDIPFYAAMPTLAAASDFAAMRGASRTLEPYASDPEAAKAKRMVDALSVLPLSAAPYAARRVPRR
jgi:hypothetical protein